MDITPSWEDEFATITIDDGKVNALDAELIDKLHAALRSVSSCRALVLRGRPGCFTAGLDTRELASLDSGGRGRLFKRLAELLLDIWLAPFPVVCAVTGHAIAAGTLLAVVTDHVVAAQGDFRWGMTEGRIGLELSDFSIMLVRARVAALHVDRLLLQGRVVDPDEAVAVGYANETAPADRVGVRAAAVARSLAELPQPAYARNKLRLRGEQARQARNNLDRDVALLVATEVASQRPAT
jgi:enoyl-CoA hydratase